MMSNFYISIYTKNLGMSLSSFLLLFNCMIEIRMIYEIWITNNQELVADTRRLKRKLMIFYIFYYLLLFILITNVTIFYCFDIWMILISSTIWVPSIINNIFKGKIKHPPILIALIISVNRTYHMFYNTLAGKEENVIRIAPNTSLFIYIICALVIQHIILYLQCYLGGSFFLPEKYRFKLNSKTSNIEFLSTSKLYSKYEDKIREECPICIYPLLSEEKISELEGKFKKISGNIQSDTSKSEVLIKDIESGDKVNLDDSTASNSASDASFMTTQEDFFVQKTSRFSIFKILDNFNFYEILWKVFYFVKPFLIMLIDFHHFSKTRTEEFIKTECKHIFHSECMKQWLNEKHQCPVDRKEIVTEELM